MKKPLIGITSFLDHSKRVPYCSLKESYVRAIEAAGGIPIILPVADPSHAGEILQKIDGLLFSGGGDIAPWLFGQEPVPGLGTYDTRLDEWEISLCQIAWKTSKPMMGICRGCQVMNVALGGTLLQDIPQKVGLSDIVLHNPAVPPYELCHSISITKGSYLSTLFSSEKPRVNSFHHQAVDTVAESLVVSARSQDGIIEALEAKDARFALALQFHPEGLWERYPEFLAPFSALVRAAKTPS